MFDVTVIGAGVVGCLTARALSRLDARVALVEADEDVAAGASKANSAIVHAGYDAKPGSLMAAYNVRGNAMMDETCAQLGAPLKRCGSLVAAFSDQETDALRELFEQGEKNGVPGMEMLSGEAARAMEPSLSGECVAALYAPTGAITCPYELTIGAYENAVKNGVTCYLGAPVTAIEKTEDGFVLTAGGQKIQTRAIVNAAGAFADEISAMAGDASFTITPRKGEYVLMDRRACRTGKVVFQAPGPMGKGVLVSPTVDGNVYAGPTAVDGDDKRDTSVDTQGIAKLRTAALKSVPGLDFRQAITCFAGVRAQSSRGDFIIGESACVPGLFQAAGICSPGLSSAPAIAQDIAGMVAGKYGLRERADFDPIRKPIRAFRHMSAAEREEAVKENPLYGRVICRCETITEAEIVEAIHRGATSVDGVKRRTRAGMGRCQGGFCQSRVMDILSRELGIPLEKITKSGGHSLIATGRLFEEADHENG